MRIERLDDPRVEDYQNVKDAELIKRRGRFIVESPESVKTFLSRCAPRARSVFVFDRHSALIDELVVTMRRTGREVPIYTAERAVMDEIVGFPIHRGCLAVGERQERWSLERLLAEVKPRRIVLTEAVSNAENIGSLFRNAAAFFADAVVVDAQSCDPLYRKAIRVSIGASLWMPQAEVRSTQDAVDRLNKAGFQTLALTPAVGSVSLDEIVRQLAPSDRIAVIVGTEGTGLSDGVLARARHRVRIPIASEVDSINVAAASAVALYALK